jgi:hypothetical protein
MFLDKKYLSTIYDIIYKIIIIYILTLDSGKITFQIYHYFLKDYIIT